MQKAEATFVIPCWNGRDYLQRLLESLLQQTLPCYEIVLVDDGSDDDSVALAKAVAKDRIKIHRFPKHDRLGSVWNLCAELATTPYFCLAHCDDRYAPTYLAKLLEALASRPDCGIAHCQAVTLDEDGRTYLSEIERYKQGCWNGSRLSPAETFGLLYLGNFINCPSILYRKEAFHQVGGFREDLSFVLDWEFVLRLLLRGQGVVAVRQPLVEYRRHDGTVSDKGTNSFLRYRQEVEVATWAKTEGMENGFLPLGTAHSRSPRNNLLYAVLADLRIGRRKRAMLRLAYGRDNIPGFGKDPLALATWTCASLGPAGLKLLNVGFDALMWRKLKGVVAVDGYRRRVGWLSRDTRHLRPKPQRVYPPQGARTR